MFKGNSSVTFKSSRSKEEVLKNVEEQLEAVGNVSLSSSGGINISGSKFSGFGYDTSIEGRISERDGRYTLSIDFDVKPAIVAWLIAVCFFPLGCVIFFLPVNAKGDIQKRMDQASSEIKSALDEK